MRINHGEAIVLESIVRRVFSCDRGGMGGYIDADHFELRLRHCGKRLTFTR